MPSGGPVSFECPNVCSLRVDLERRSTESVDVRRFKATLAVLSVNHVVRVL